MRIELPVEIETSLLIRSRAEGRSPQALVFEALARDFPPQLSVERSSGQATLADCLDGWIGCLEPPKKRRRDVAGFVDGLKRKKEAGHL